MPTSEKSKKISILSIPKALISFILIPASILASNLFVLFKIFENGKLQGLYPSSGLEKKIGNRIMEFLFTNQNYLYILAIFVFQIFLLYLAGKFQAAEKKNWIDFNQILRGLIFLPVFLIVIFLLLMAVSFSSNTKVLN